MKELPVTLGISSFRYILKQLGKESYYTSKKKDFLMLIFPDKQHQVEVRYRNKKSHCGYIVIDPETMNELYENHANSIRTFSEVKSGAFGIEHCSVSLDPAKRGKTLIDDIICYYTPPPPPAPKN